MVISVNTNMSSLTAQNSLNKTTKRLNQSMERLSTGYNILHSKDNAVGMSLAQNFTNKIKSLSTTEDNAQFGTSLLNTSEGIFNTINSNLTRIRDLTEQAANGTYGSDALGAIYTEVQARLDEITRVAQSTEFNGLYLLNGSITNDIDLQVGIDNTDNSIIKLSAELFADVSASALLNIPEGKCADAFISDTTARTFLTNVDNAILKITTSITKIGGTQQKISSAIDTIEVLSKSMTESVSNIQDTDIADESSNYVKQQILQEVSASMLTTANQSPSMALNLL